MMSDNPLAADPRKFVAAITQAAPRMGGRMLRQRPAMKAVGIQKVRLFDRTILVTDSRAVQEKKNHGPQHFLSKRSTAQQSTSGIFAMESLH